MNVWRVIGHYRVEDGFVVMCRPDGVPIELNGKRFRRKFGTKSGELNEREVARLMTLEIRHELKRSPYSPVAGFSSLRKNLGIGALAVFLPRVLGRSGCCEQTLT